MAILVVRHLEAGGLRPLERCFNILLLVSIAQSHAGMTTSFPPELEVRRIRIHPVVLDSRFLLTNLPNREKAYAARCAT
ncbi:hypothetical protein [Streptomyces sp. CAU 1734]|uniref:hypothetical protein n=1 Tax=Streptomyces sp. CAU 1734 TaxID=3140360 RepID=UPI003261A1B3